MRWPWQSAPVEHRSSYTDQVVTAILQSASGGGVRPALATAALETVATLYSSALSACAVSGPPSVVRALDATWRASVASSLVRHGQALYILDADPSAGLALAPVSHWDVHGGPERATWLYRCAAGWAILDRLAHAKRGRGAPSPLDRRRRAAVGGCQSATARARYRQSRGLARQATE